MRKLLLTLALAAAALLGHAQEVIVMDKAMFIDKVFDYENSKEWKYKGDKPAIIDLYADWCGPCRKVAPIMKELAKEYAGKITIYKVNVDKEQELAALFNATSIPLFVLIPLKEQPQLMRGAADKATYKKAIDEFLLSRREAFASRDSFPATWGRFRIRKFLPHGVGTFSQAAIPSPRRRDVFASRDSFPTASGSFRRSELYPISRSTQRPACNCMTDVKPARRRARNASDMPLAMRSG